MSKIIGIDLGTTNSCVAVMEGNEPVVITNARSQIDADALNTALSRLFFSIHGQGGGPI